MTQIPIDESPFGRVVREPIPPRFRWEGAMHLELAGRPFEARGTIDADLDGVRALITYEGDEFEGITLENGQVITIPLRLDYEPNVMIPDRRIARLTPASGSWTAEPCFVALRLPTGNRGAHGLVWQVNLFCQALVFSEPSTHSARYTRIVYTFAHVPSPTTTTWHAHGCSVDSVEGRFQGVKVRLRNLNAGPDSDDVPQAQQVVVAVIDKPHLNETQLRALWMLVGLLSGNLVREVCHESYDNAGNLIERRYRPGAGATEDRAIAFDFVNVPFEPAYLEVIGDGFVRMLRTGFPIDIMLQHLHRGQSGYPDVDAQSLLLGIHAAIEAWSRRFGRRTLLETSSWSQLRVQVLGAMKPLNEQLGKELAESVAQKINSANWTSTRSRTKKLFSDLRIIMDRSDWKALDTRNELLHEGHFLRRFEELTQTEQQERLDLRWRLTNLIREVILRCCGFRGTIIEARRLGRLMVESDFSPLFTPGTQGGAPTAIP